RHILVEIKKESEFCLEGVNVIWKLICWLRLISNFFSHLLIINYLFCEMFTRNPIADPEIQEPATNCCGEYVDFSA
ncbi:MAG: hypothetical protein RI568_13245, partial [Natronomonas sp.]|uniref:hypothetical protein n=1 Tax=Natronomonas sp. TaxID=2184060 RepID=UPI0028701CC9